MTSTLNPLNENQIGVRSNRSIRSNFSQQQNIISGGGVKNGKAMLGRPISRRVPSSASIPATTKMQSYDQRTYNFEGESHVSGSSLKSGKSSSVSISRKSGPSDRDHHPQNNGKRGNVKARSVINLQNEKENIDPSSNGDSCSWTEGEKFIPYFEFNEQILESITAKKKRDELKAFGSRKTSDGFSSNHNSISSHSISSTFKNGIITYYQDQKPIKFTDDQLSLAIVDPNFKNVEGKLVCLKLLIKLFMDTYSSQMGGDCESLQFILLEMLGSSDEVKIQAFDLLFNIALHLGLFSSSESSKLYYRDWIFNDLQDKLIVMLRHLWLEGIRSAGVWKAAVRCFLAFFPLTICDRFDVSNAGILLAIIRQSDDLSIEVINYFLRLFIMVFYDKNSFKLELYKIEKFGGISIFLALLREQVDYTSHELLLNVIFDYVVSVEGLGSKVELQRVLEAEIRKHKYWNRFWSLLFGPCPEYLELKDKGGGGDSSKSNAAKKIAAFLVTLDNMAISYYWRRQLDEGVNEMLHEDRYQFVDNFYNPAERHLGQLLLRESLLQRSRASTSSIISGNQLDRILKGSLEITTTNSNNNSTSTGKTSLKFSWPSVRLAALDIIFGWYLLQLKQSVSATQVIEMLNIYLLKFVKAKENDVAVVLRIYQIVLHVICFEGASIFTSDAFNNETFKRILALKKDDTFIFNFKNLSSLNHEVLLFLFNAIPLKSYKGPKLLVLKFIQMIKMNSVENDSSSQLLFSPSSSISSVASLQSTTSTINSSNSNNPNSSILNALEFKYFPSLLNSRDPHLCFMVSAYLVWYYQCCFKEVVGRLLARAVVQAIEVEKPHWMDNPYEVALFLIKRLKKLQQDKH